MKCASLLAATLGLALLSGSPSPAFTLSSTEWNGGRHYYSWAEPDRSIRFYLNDRPLSLLTNFAANSALDSATREAMLAWEIPQVLQMRPEGTSTIDRVAQDGVSLITMADTPSARDLTTNYWAVCQVFLKVIDSRLFIREADIVFDPRRRFATDGSLASGDFQGILTHELGHALGLSHSALPTATMYGGGIGADTLGRTPSADDLAGQWALYLSGADLQNGSLAGQVLAADGDPVFGAHVLASDTSGVAHVGVITDRQGNYTIPCLPPGSYQVYAEPLDGPMTSAQLTRTDEFRGARQEFMTTFAGGNLSPATLAVAAGTTTHVEPVGVALTVPEPNPSNFLWSFDWRTWRGGQSAQVHPGDILYLAVYGRAMDRVPAGGFRFSGDDISVDQGKIVRSSSPAVDPPYAVLPLTVRATARLGPRNLYISTGAELVAYSGLLEVVAG